MPIVNNFNNYKKNNFAVIISSPSGAGKTTVTKKLLKLFHNSHLSISCTTRAKRRGEVNGKDYFFLTKNNFIKFKKQKKFIEWAKVHNHFYGTLKKQVFSNLKKKLVFFDVDWQGARVLKKKLKSNCFSVFLLPPSINILKKRLLKRHKDNTKIALDRFKFAKKDIIHFSEYDYLIVNDDLKKCTKTLSKKINELLRDKKLEIKTNLLVKKMLHSN